MFKTMKGGEAWDDKERDVDDMKKVRYSSSMVPLGGCLLTLCSPTGSPGIREVLPGLVWPSRSPFVGLPTEACRQVQGT